MTQRKTKVGSLPSIPAGMAPDLRRFFEGVAESIQTMQGQRGDKLDQVLRMRDIQPGSTVGSFIINAVAKQITNDTAPSTDPLSVPTTFQAISAFGSVLLVWDYNRSPNYVRTEVFRTSVALDTNGQPVSGTPAFNESFLYGSISGDRFNDNVSEWFRYHYWVRHINAAGVPGATAGPVWAESAPIPTAILDRIQAEINDEEFLQGLADAIALSEVQPIIDQLEADLTAMINAGDAAVAQANANTAAALAAADTRLTNADGILNQAIASANTARAAADSVLQQNIDAANTARVSLDTRLTNADAVLNQAIADMGVTLTAQGSQITSLNSTTATQATQLSTLSTNVGNQGTSIASLQTTTASQATAISRLGAYDIPSSKYSFILTLEQADAGLATRATALETDNTSSKSRIGTLETTTASQATRLTTLETDNTSNKSRITTQETTTAGHATRLTSIESVNTSQGTSITSLNTTTATHATAISRLGAYDTGAGKYTFISTLEQADATLAARTTTLESDNTSNKSRITTQESTTAGHATRLTSIESLNATQGTSISTLQTTTDSHALSISRLGAYDTPAGKYSFIKTLEQADTALASRTTVLETDNGANKSNITSLQTTTATQATKITTLETDNTTNKSNITSLQTTTGTHATRLTTLETDNTSNKSRITTQETTTAGHATRLGTLETDNGTNKTNITNLQTTDTSHASQLTQLTAASLPLPESMISEKTWVPGTSGVQPGFPTQNGGGAGQNIIINGVGPYGTPTRIWRGKSSGVNGADGGFHSDSKPIDRTKRYRFSCWMRAGANNTLGNVYLGLGSAPVNILNMAGVSQGNPYFMGGGTMHRTGGNAGKWLLYVGVIHPTGYSGAASTEAGVYDPVTGVKISACTDFMAAPTATHYTLRAYQYYAGASTTEILDFAHPRIEALDGTEVPFADLLRPAALSSVITRFDTVTTDQANSLATLNTTVGTQGSAITTLSTTKADSAATTTAISTAKGEAIASAIASAQTYTDTKTGALQAEYVLKVGVDGTVAGFGLLANPLTGSAIAFNANKITFVNPTGADQDLGLGLQIKDNTLYFNRAVARDITVENLTFKRGIGVDLSVIDSLQLPIGKITEANLAPDFVNRIVLRDPNAVTTGGNELIMRQMDFGIGQIHTGSFVTAAIVGGGDLTRITMNISLGHIETTIAPTVPSYAVPQVEFRIKRGATYISIPTDVMNAINANSFGYSIAANGNGYIVTGNSTKQGEPMPGGVDKLWERDVNLRMQFAFDAGYYTGSSAFTLEIVNTVGDVGTLDLSMNVFESTSSSDGLIVNTNWSNIMNKPATFAPSAHSHDAADVVSGIFPIARGGTGRSDGKATGLVTARKINGIDFDASADITVPAIYDADITRIQNPVGGYFAGATAAPVGAIAITLPVTFNNTMVTVSVRVFEYVAGRSFDLSFSGYCRSATSDWNNCTAYTVGSPGLERTFNVRFGHDSATSKLMVYIGELNSTWSYPQISILDVTCGYSGRSTLWTTGWAIGFEATAFKGVTYTVAAEHVGSGASTNSANRVVKRDASGNFSAGTITAALNGNASSATTATTAGDLTVKTGANLNTGALAGKLEYFEGNVLTGAPNTNWHSIISARHNSGTLAGFQLAYQFYTQSFSVRGTDGTNYLPWIRMFTDDYHPNADTWTSARSLTVGNTGKAVNGSANVSWSLAEIGALPLTGGNLTGNLGLVSYSSTNPGGGSLVADWLSNWYRFRFGGTDTPQGLSISYYDSPTITLNKNGTVTAASFVGPLTGNATTASSLQTARKINGIDFNASADIVVPTIYDADFTRITNPGGGTFFTTTSAITGALAITLPVAFANTMVTLSLRVYDYATGRTFDMVISGYPYTTTSAWSACTAYVVGSPTLERNFNVRFGYDSAVNKVVIYIGELTTGWNYPQVSILDVTCGFAGRSLTWTTGWSIGFEATAFKAVTATIGAEHVGYGLSTNIANKLVKRDASGNFSAGTITAALSGNATTATTLQTTRAINGTNFNGSAAITTALWGTARNLTIGNTAKSVNGSANVSWSIAEIGALALTGGILTGFADFTVGMGVRTGQNILLNSLSSGIGWGITETNADGFLRFRSRSGTGAWTEQAYFSYVDGRLYDGTGGKYMKWSDFTASAQPPAGLENVITANWIASGVVTANLIASNGLNVTNDKYSLKFLTAEVPIELRKADGSLTFMISANGTGFFSGGLGDNTVTLNAISVEARRGINPYYNGYGETVSVSPGTFVASGSAAAAAIMTTLVVGDRINISCRVSDFVEWNGLNTRPTYTNSIYQLKVQRSVSGGAWTDVPNGSQNVTVYGYSNAAKPQPEPEPANAGYQYEASFNVTDQLTAASASIQYRVLVTCTTAGTGTAGGLKFAKLTAEKSAFIKNTATSSTDFTRWTDKETGFTILTGKVTVAANSSVNVVHGVPLISVVSEIAQVDFSGYGDWSGGAAAATTTYVTVYNQNDISRVVKWFVYGFVAV